MTRCKPANYHSLSVHGAEYSYSNMHAKRKRMGLTHWKTTTSADEERRLSPPRVRVSNTSLVSLRIDPVPPIGCAAGNGLAPLQQTQTISDGEWHPKTSTVTEPSFLGDHRRYLRYHVKERCRIKDFKSYKAETVLQNFKLPLILRKPVCEGRAASERKAPQRLALPPISHDGSMVLHRSLWRDSLDRGEKVASIPPVERRMEKRLLRNRVKLEAKGTKVPKPKYQQDLKGSNHSNNNNHLRIKSSFTNLS